MKQRDLSHPRNLIHAVRSALGLPVRQVSAPTEWSPAGYESLEKYPPNLELEGQLPDGRRVRLLAARRVRRSGTGRGLHRLQIECAECGRWIPVGRVFQHKGTVACRLYNTCKRHEDCRANLALARACFAERKAREGRRDPAERIRRRR